MVPDPTRANAPVAITTKLGELTAFFEHVRQSGILSPNAVHNWTGAIGAISHCLDESEATLEFIQSRPEVIRNRLINGERAISRQTVEAYLQRATSAVDHFLAWRRNPSAWEQEMAAHPRRRRRRNRVPHARADSRPSGTAEAPRPTLPLAAPALTEYRNLVQIPTEGGKTIRLEFPDSFRMSDVLRVVWALSVHATDFDPEHVLKAVGKPPSSRDESSAKALFSLSAG